MFQIWKYAHASLNWLYPSQRVTAKQCYTTFVYLSSSKTTQLTSLFLFSTCSKRVGLAGRSPMEPVLCFEAETEPSTQSWALKTKQNREVSLVSYIYFLLLKNLKSKESAHLIDLQRKTATERNCIYSTSDLFSFPHYLHCSISHRECSSNTDELVF